jgi:hypothetical protein
VDGELLAGRLDLTHPRRRFESPAARAAHVGVVAFEALDRAVDLGMRNTTGSPVSAVSVPTRSWTCLRILTAAARGVRETPRG